MARKQLDNGGEDSLASAATSGTTTLTVLDGALFPATGDYNLVISSDDTYEVVVCTSRSTNALTVVRAQEGTAGVAHPAGAKVVLTLTPDSFYRFVTDEVASPNNDDSNGVYGIRDTDGKTLTSADFTWFNQGTGTVEDYEDGSICLQTVGNVAANSQRILERPFPAAPFKVTVATISQLHNNNDARAYSPVGVCVRDSAGGRLWTTSISVTDSGLIRDRVYVLDYSSISVVDSGLEIFDMPVGRGLHFFQIELDDAEVVTFRTSAGGHYWREFVNDSSAFAMDRIGFFANPGDSGTNANNYQVINTLVGWQEELL